MQAFEYVNPTTKEEAVKALSSEGAVALAGGTDLLSLMKDSVEVPKRLVNLKSIKELQGIQSDKSKGLRIGALVTLAQLAANPAAKQYQALLQAIEGVHSPQIQNVATVAGDLCQRPRCWYYRNGFGLLALKDGKSMVVEGDNRYHAILGTSGPAYFVNPSSLASVLIALKATIRTFGPNGAKEVPVEQFFRVPSTEGEKEYVLANDEIITEIVVPATSAKTAVYEVRQRECLDWPLTAATAVLEMSGKNVASARLVLGHVAPTPWVVADVDSVLKGKSVTEQLADQVGELAVKGAKPLSRNAYKVRLARVAAKRAVMRAAGMEV